MNWNFISAIADVIAASAVTASLVYLAVQVRSNTKELKSTSAQDTHETLMNGYLEIAKDANLNRILRQGTLDNTVLTAEETGQFFALWTYVLYLTQNWLYQRSSNTLDESLSETWMNGISANFHLPGFQHYWKHRKQNFSQELIDYVEEIMSGPPVEPGHVPLGIAID